MRFNNGTMNKTYATALPYLKHLDKHRSWPVPLSIRNALKAVVQAMAGQPEDTVVSAWVERQLPRGV